MIKTRHSESKLAHVHEQSESTHSGELVAAEHFNPGVAVVPPRCFLVVFFYFNLQASW